MNIKKTKIEFVLTSTLFLSLPMSQVFAAQAHCEIKETALGENMEHTKSELRAYVENFKKGDTEKMQKHLGVLIKLSEKARDYTPVKISHMSHSHMDHGDMNTMDHSQMNHGDMNMNAADHDMSTMPSMEQLQYLFKSLKKTQDTEEIKAILGEIKQHSKKSHQQFRQNC